MKKLICWSILVFSTFNKFISLVVLIGFLFLGMVLGAKNACIRRTIPFVKHAPQWINIYNEFEEENEKGSVSIHFSSSENVNPSDISSVDL